MNIKRIMALVLALVMVLSLVVMGFQVLASEETTKPAPDVDLEDDDDFTLEFDDLVDAVGTEINPIEIQNSGDFTAEVKANSETYYAVSSYLNGMVVTIVGDENTTVTLNGAEVTPDEEYVFIAELTATPTNELVVANGGNTDVELIANINYPLGTIDNPIIINSIDELDLYTVPAQGDLYIMISSYLSGKQLSVAAEEGLEVTVNGVKLTAEDYSYTTVLNGAPSNRVVLTNNTDADISVFPSIVEAPGSESNPIWLNDYENTVDVTGTTWLATFISGVEATVTGNGDFTVAVNGQDLAAADGKVTFSIAPMNPMFGMYTTIAITGEGSFQINFVVPVGTMDNPAELVIGPNSAEIAAGSQGYYYTWTAPEDGTLTITMPTNIGWIYVINNMTSWVYGDQQWSDSDPVVNPATIEVAAGDELQIMVNTYDPANEWNAPEGTLTLNAAFEPAAPLTAELNAIEVSCEAETVIRLKMKLPAELLADEDAYIKLSMDGFGGVRETILTMADVQNPEIVNYDKSGRYVIEQGVKSVEMTRKVTMQIYTGSGKLVTLYDKTELVGTELSRSVLDYATLALTKGTAAQQNLMVALLTYGAKAQLYFEAFTDDLATDLLTELGFEVPNLSGITGDTIGAVAKQTGDDIGLTNSTSQAYLDSAIYHRVYLNVAAGHSIDEYTFEVYYPAGKDSATNEVIVMSKSVEAVYEASRSRYYVDLTDIGAPYLDFDYKLIATQTETGKQYVVETSVLAYLVRGLNSTAATAAQKDMFRALYNYNQIANEFFGM